MNLKITLDLGEEKQRDIQTLYKELEEKCGTNIFDQLMIYQELDNFFGIQADDILIEKLREKYIISNYSSVYEFILTIRDYLEYMEIENEEQELRNNLDEIISYINCTSCDDSF